MIDATIAPKARSRIANEIGSVTFSVSSRPRLMSSLMSWLMKVLSMTWSVRVGLAARAASTIGRTPARRAVTRSFPPAILPMIRTVVPSGETRPAPTGALKGSVTDSNVLIAAPFSGAVASVSFETRSETAA